MYKDERRNSSMKFLAWNLDQCGQVTTERRSDEPIETMRTQSRLTLVRRNENITHDKRGDEISDIGHLQLGLWMSCFQRLACRDE